MTGLQWHELDHTQIICTSLQTDNHASTSSLTIYMVNIRQIYTTINFTDEFRNVSVTLICRRQKWAWLAGCGRRGQHTLSIEKQT